MSFLMLDNLYTGRTFCGKYKYFATCPENSYTVKLFSLMGSNHHGFWHRFQAPNIVFSNAPNQKLINNPLYDSTNYLYMYHKT